MRHSILTDKQCGKEYKTPYVQVVNIGCRSIICASSADTEDYNIADNIWDIPDNDFII